MWATLLLGLTSAAFNQADFKMDIICYENSGTFCEGIGKQFSEDYWKDMGLGEYWKHIKDLYGKFVYASETNTQDSFKQTSNYLVLVYMVDTMPTGTEPFDLSQLSDKSLVSFVDMAFAKTLASENVENGIKLVRSQVKALAKLKKLAKEGRIAGRQELGRAMLDLLRAKERKYQEPSDERSQVAESGNFISRTFNIGCLII